MKNTHDQLTTQLIITPKDHHIAKLLVLTNMQKIITRPRVGI